MRSRPDGYPRRSSMSGRRIDVDAPPRTWQRWFERAYSQASKSRREFLALPRAGSLCWSGILRARNSGSIFGRPLLGQDFQRQYALKAWRCPFTTVASWMIWTESRTDGTARKARQKSIRPTIPRGSASVLLGEATRAAGVTPHSKLQAKRETESAGSCNRKSIAAA